jgi:hypothetical protein
MPARSKLVMSYRIQTLQTESEIVRIRLVHVETKNNEKIRGDKNNMEKVK